MRAKYRMRDYLKVFVGKKTKCLVCDLPMINEEKCFEHLFKFH